MSSRPLCFVQAGDFSLHQPLHGLAEVPDHLVNRLIEAPYQAAQRVFEAAINAEADFLLLTGNLCDPHRTGPRGLIFLAKQFARLTERRIAVYWAASPMDGRGDWPEQLKWPTGVHVFESNRVEHLTHHRDGKPICQIAGRSIDDTSASRKVPAAAFAPDTDGLFSIAIVPGPLPFATGELPTTGDHFWSCGGSGQATTTKAQADPPCVVHCAGTPQGRAPQDIGPHGCTIVHVEETKVADQDQIRLTPTAADVVRWHEERIPMPGPFEQAELERRLHEQMNGLITAGPGSGIYENSVLLVRWLIAGSHSDVSGFNQSPCAAELLAKLRTEYGFRETPAWSVSLATTPPELPASWSEQQTLLGEFLRRIRDLESPSDEGHEFDGFLECFLTEEQSVGPNSERLNLVDPASRTTVLRQAAILGADLLSTGSATRGASVQGDSSRAKGATLR